VSDTPCCPRSCLFTPAKVRLAVRFILVCQRMQRRTHDATMDPVVVAYRAVYQRDEDRPVLDGQRREFRSGNPEADSDEVLLVASVKACLEQGYGIREFERIAQACCPYALPIENVRDE
jgi:hypothetical protein